MAQNQTDITDLIGTGSLDEATVKARQNKVEVVAAKALSGNIDAGVKNDLAAIDANTSIQRDADAAQVGFAVAVNDVTVKLQDEIKGTNNTLAAFNANYERVLADYEKVASDSKGFSFFTNPIATIRNHVVMSQQKDQLNTLVGAINSGNAHIDDAYARSAQKINDYKATVMNVNQAELMAKANEVKFGYERQKVQIDAELKKNALALKASQSQQFKAADPYDKARAAEEKAVMDDQVLRYMWKVQNNYADIPFTPEAGKLMKQTLETSPEAEQGIWTKATARHVTSPAPQREAGETPEQFAQKQLRVDIGRNGDVDGPEFARVVSGATNTVFNPLFKMADAELMATAGEIDWEKEAAALGVTGGAAQLKQQQIKIIQQKKNAELAQISQPQRLNLAGNAIARDMTLTATKNTVPPFKFAQATTLVAASGGNQRAIDFFTSDEAKVALEVTPSVTGNTKLDTVLALNEAMRAARIPKSDIPTLIAKYIDAAYKADYSINGERANEYQGLQQLMPDAEINFRVDVSHKSAEGIPQTFNLRDPVDVANMLTRQAKPAGLMFKVRQTDQMLRNLPMTAAAVAAGVMEGTITTNPAGE